MTMTRVTVTGNESWGEGGGVWTHSERKQTIVDSTITDNHAGVPHIEEDGLLSDDVAGGGGLMTDGGLLTILRTTINGNSATEEGGGLSIHNLGDVTIADSIDLEQQGVRRRRPREQRASRHVRAADRREQQREGRRRRHLQHVERRVPHPRHDDPREHRRHRRRHRERAGQRTSSCAARCSSTTTRASR